jgi:hypothetical protein
MSFLMEMTAFFAFLQQTVELRHRVERARRRRRPQIHRPRAVRKKIQRPGPGLQQ